MTYLLTALVTLYLGFHASKMDPRPEDRKDAEIADGAGELASSRRTAGGRCGAAPPSACSSSACVGAWWLFIIGVGLGAMALCGWIFEYYRGEHAH